VVAIAENIERIYKQNCEPGLLIQPDFLFDRSRIRAGEEEDRTSVKYCGEEDEINGAG